MNFSSYLPLVGPMKFQDMEVVRYKLQNSHRHYVPNFNIRYNIYSDIFL